MFKFYTKVKSFLLKNAKRIKLFCIYAIFLFFFVLLLQITLQYIPIQLDVAFLAIKQSYIDIIPWRVAFFTHVFTSMFALLAGFTQFSKWFLKKYTVAHRWVGKVYVMNVVFITGPASFIMSLYANGGLSSRIAFTTLSVLWIFTTAKAWQLAKQKKFIAHRNYMMRSYALTVSAITLRAWKWLFVVLFHPRPMDVYQIVAWLGWVPNILLVEWMIYRYAIKAKQKNVG